jgi:DNA-binding SARP family transcriptional activator
MEFRILGPLEVVQDGRPIPLGRKLTRALLAYLLLHANERVSADRLIEELWGSPSPRTATASLQNYVSRLRKLIGPERIASEAAGYVLRIDPEHLDLAKFDRLVTEARSAAAGDRVQLLRAALALWRGRPLEDLEFEDFAQEEIAQLSERRLAAMEERIAAELELGDGAQLVEDLEALIAEQPLRERPRALLMRALYRAGRQADALAAYQAARDVLSEELGLEPGEELRALQHAILRQDPALGPATQAAVERAPDRRTVTVLLCDLVGSTDLAAQLDPEAFRALMSRYFELVREPIERHGGTLEKFIGDAVMAVFGVPELHEDDALRAVRAAVETQEALRGEDIAARIGVSTGEVHVLSAPGEPLHVSGPPASVASQLESRAPAGGVLLSGETYGLVRDALRAERFGDAWRVEDVVPGAPAYARRLDAPLVGRGKELERLRAAYADARASRRCRVVTVIGEAGIGKTRLMRELVSEIRDEARILVGRCVSYGEGATYLPIAEAVRQAVPEPSIGGIAALLEGEDDAEQVAVRVAELTGLTEAPGAPGEAFWAVRRFVETIARKRPLVLVLDDIHWAEPTLLDLVEYLGEWAVAPVLVLSAARRELLETRPGWGGPTSTGFVVGLAALAPEEVTTLVSSLSEAPVDPDVEQLIVEQAGGNPLFAEQLLAMSTEAPDLPLDETPPNVEALLASRLDRLGARELAVLRRASVIGRRFTRAELADLTPPEDVQRTEHSLDELADRALVHPREHVFAFHHVLVRDVAYRGIPKAERADLHELAARGLDRRDGADEMVGYHFEQAYRALTDIARADAHARELAVAGGERLGRAGIRAWKRADLPAAVNLLSRALELSRETNELACELGVALLVRGEIERAKAILAGVAEASERRIAARAHFELANARSMTEPDRADELFDAVASSIPVLEAAGDHRALGRAWLCVAHVRGGFFCEYTPMEEAAARAVDYYKRAGWSASTALNNLGAALFFGAKPVNEAIEQLETLVREFDRDHASQANVLMWLGGLLAMRGLFDDARARVESAKTLYVQLGHVTAVDQDCSRMLGFVELLAGNAHAAEKEFRSSCTSLEQHGQMQVLATRAGELAQVLYEEGRYDEAEAWTRLAEDTAGGDDLDAALAWKPVDAMLLARRHASAEGEQRLRELLGVTPADALHGTARAVLALAEIFWLSGRDAEAAETVAGAVALYERKGNIVGARRAQSLLLEPA